MKSESEIKKIRSNAATLALSAAVVLTVFKFMAAALSGSIGVYSEAIHSLLDLTSAAIAFIAIREAVRPADDSHPFGHGKIETVSSLFETLLLLAAGVYIFFEGIERFQHPRPLEHEWVAIGVIFISMVASFVVFRHNQKAAELTHSSAIRVNALHYFADVASSAGILVGLIVIKFTGFLIIDAIMALGVATYILYTSLREFKKVFNELIDVRLPEEERKKIKEILLKFQKKALGIHWLRTRRSGSTRHIDFHMVVCRFMSVEESHLVCDEIEEAIKSKFHGSSVRIHVEPCNHRESDDKHHQVIDCQKHCPFPERRKP